MLTIRALESIVGSKQVRDYRVAADPSRNHGFILCPDEDDAEKLRGRYVRVGNEKIFFDVVSNVGYLPFHEDVNQHARVVKMNWSLVMQNLKIRSWQKQGLCSSFVFVLSFELQYQTGFELSKLSFSNACVIFKCYFINIIMKSVLFYFFNLSYESLSG